MDATIESVELDDCYTCIEISWQVLLKLNIHGSWSDRDIVRKYLKLNGLYNEERNHSCFDRAENRHETRLAALSVFKEYCLENNTYKRFKC
jgi:hypothetical protein